MIHIPFNKPYMTGQELGYISDAHANLQFAGDGAYTKRCSAWLEERTGTKRALLTHSCTAALEMSALLAGIGPGDEIIMPSYTFVSTANAFVLRGGVPVFVDIRADTLNLDESLIEAAVTPRTRAIVPVHYAGVGCEMDSILAIAQRHNLLVIEDAAQGVTSAYRGKALGSIGDFGTYSFHETKNVISGEGGALLVNTPENVLRAEIIREKGTDRSRFFRGEVDKYTWQEVGSSFLPGELTAAFLWAQLEQADRIRDERLSSWGYYHDRLASAEEAGIVRRPIVPDTCTHNAHMYYVLLAADVDRDTVLQCMKQHGIGAVFHYVPLHTAPAGRVVGRAHGALPVTEALSARLVRLPLWVGLTRNEQDEVIHVLLRSIDLAKGKAETR
ncbi:dTDP-4-amino-4,6-dideoxygalactose transaminase [Paraburkholderia kirstenboschensis]|uniref:dTDP-4-amino-4,6-dideoxygalactose transaminase n=1 Tax=Paraburkholderia kirstenboschensis TaxID=1245436 RepID=A0ABZ0EN80_9BURK|nr:dTDP-4-amino-4,6-dideoxygalactose transaminase [Paraburkholderia kirstenboschensis]WOD18646.1 dTDP-4-amino-4,6-dideoxygalactose transaminase [Paraburkholderia kirstenboschensis]